MFPFRFSIRFTSLAFPFVAAIMSVVFPSFVTFFVDAPRSVNLGVVDACVANDGAVGVGDVNAGVVVVVVVVPGGSRASAASAAAVDRNPAFARCS